MNRLLKEINRLLSKGLSNIYLKVAIDQKLRFSKFKKFVSRYGFCADIIEFSNLLLQLKYQRSGSKTGCGFSII